MKSSRQNISDGLRAWEEGAYDLLLQVANRAGELALKAKASYLTKLGWQEVPGENGGVAWKAPLTFTGKPHYFDLESAYALETEGEGLIAYSTKELTGELLRAKDEALGSALEAAYTVI